MLRQIAGLNLAAGGAGQSSQFCQCSEPGGVHGIDAPEVQQYLLPVGQQGGNLVGEKRGFFTERDSPHTIDNDGAIGGTTMPMQIHDGIPKPLPPRLLYGLCTGTWAG